MFRYVLKLLAIIATWLIIQSGYDLRVRNQCSDYQRITRTATIYSHGICYAADSDGRFKIILDGLHIVR